MPALAATFNAGDVSTPVHYGPSQTALLLLDFHSLFVQQQAGGPNAPAALAVAAQMRTWAQSQGMHVIHALVDIDATPYPTCRDPDKFVGMAAAMKSGGGGGGEEAAELREGGAGDDVVFTRRPGYVSALKSPGLDGFLRRNGVRSLVLTGLSTSGCVLGTAIAASDAEYVVSVISDGCADRVEEVHDVVLRKLVNKRGYVHTAAEFQKGYGEAVGGK